MMDVSYLCDTGGRENNEDAVGIFQEGDLGCFVVADGLGGHSSGEIASRTVAGAITDGFSLAPEVSARRLEALFDAAQAELSALAAGSKALHAMRTTAAVLLTDSRTAVWAHMGDSRVYHFHQNQISSITSDHSVAYLSYQAGEIKFSDIRTSPDQNRLLRSLGTQDQYKPQVSDPTSVTAGDAFLLCSDGFWEYVTEKEMEKSLAASSTASRWLAKMVRVLNQAAGKDSENDNYSAVAVRF